MLISMKTHLTHISSEKCYSILLMSTDYFSISTNKYVDINKNALIDIFRFKNMSQYTLMSTKSMSTSTNKYVDINKNALIAHI